ncbi:hypothetical protein RRF57_009255 [Xylaria bambusicola]|uniref:Uncharacterized protein n=1 Tax=Xylaria bambusicola TaxID=326684 RepID=A0AAN7UV92_9PEZI
MLANKAGENDRNPLDNVSASAFSMPSVSCEGETSLSASWAPVNAMLTPGPSDKNVGAMTQNAISPA